MLMLALAAMMTPAAVAAQSDDAIASVTVTAGGDVTVVNTAGLAFGTYSSGFMVHSSDVPTAASWNLSFTDPGDYAITFTLPNQLVDVALTGLTVPISYGPTSAHSPGLPIPFDPATGIGVHTDGPTSADILLGADMQGDGTGDVSVNLLGAAAGTYQATITLTVAPI